MLNSDFKECAGSFAAHGVEYLIVGGYALAAHGQPRYTGDIDFWVRTAPDNVQRVLAALHDFGFGSLGLTAADFEPGAVIQLGHPPRRIDILTSIDGVDFDACFGRRETVRWEGIDLNIIGLDDFKANKRAAGRLKDLADLESLERPPG